MKLLAIIPTRAKSSGLPGKSIRPLGGKPLVQHTIDQAKRVGLFADIVVVSDGEPEIRMARDSGCLAIRKPDSISGGDVVIERVIEFVLTVLERNGRTGYDAFMELNPTSPLRSDKDILDSVKEMESSGCTSVVSVIEEKPIIMKRVRSGKKGFWHCAIKSQNRDQRPPVYIQNGAIYLTKVDFFKVGKKILAPKCHLHVMTEERSVDIDTIWDFLAAEVFLKELERQHGSGIELQPELLAPKEAGGECPANS